jgi:nitrilase
MREQVARDEGLVIAEVDAARVREERHNFDPTGHYGRPDVFELRVDRRRLATTRFSDEP